MADDPRPRKPLPAWMTLPGSLVSVPDDQVEDADTAQDIAASNDDPALGSNASPEGDSASHSDASPGDLTHSSENAASDGEGAGLTGNPPSPGAGPASASPSPGAGAVGSGPEELGATRTGHEPGGTGLGQESADQEAAAARGSEVAQAEDALSEESDPVTPAEDVAFRADVVSRTGDAAAGGKGTAVQGEGAAVHGEDAAVHGESPVARRENVVAHREAVDADGEAAAAHGAGAVARGESAVDGGEGADLAAGMQLPGAGAAGSGTEEFGATRAGQERGVTQTGQESGIGRNGQEGSAPHTGQESSARRNGQAGRGQNRQAPRDQNGQAPREQRGQASRDQGGQAGRGQEHQEVPLKGALEAILMVVDEPVQEVTLAQVLERPTHLVAAALRELAEEYEASGRGFDLRQVAGGWRYYTRPGYAPFVERFVRDGQQTRLTQAALETLAVVAYRQPVSRARVAAVRGVNSDGVMRTLVARGLVEEAGTDPESQAVLYRTSSYFLERLGLNDISELPELAPFLPDDVENIEETST